MQKLLIMTTPLDLGNDEGYQRRTKEKPIKRCKTGSCFYVSVEGKENRFGIEAMRSKEMVSIDKFKPGDISVIAWLYILALSCGKHPLSTIYISASIIIQVCPFIFSLGTTHDEKFCAFFISLAYKSLIPKQGWQIISTETEARLHFFYSSWHRVHLSKIGRKLMMLLPNYSNSNQGDEPCRRLPINTTVQK